MIYSKIQYLALPANLLHNPNSINICTNIIQDMRYKISDTHPKNSKITDTGKLQCSTKNNMSGKHTYAFSFLHDILGYTETLVSLEKIVYI